MKLSAPTRRRFARALPARRRHARSSTRSGMSVVAVLAASIVFAVLAAALVRQQAQRKQLITVQRQRMQCQLLLESAQQLALSRLSTDPQYQGEIWHIAADQLEAAHAAAVELRVEPAGEGGQPTLIVVADYPADLPQRIRLSGRYELPERAALESPITTTSED